MRKMQMPVPLRDKLIELCGFTDEETDIFIRRTRGHSIIQIADSLHISEATVNRRVRCIWNKIDKAVTDYRHEIDT